MTNVPTQIGQYRVEAQIGQGGMGVVYKAIDTRLERAVAIKALPEHFASDPERLARFEREAKTLAALNHPNVAAIYGVETDQDATYIVMEFVDGHTLSDMLENGPIPLDEAIEICSQIAQGLEAAHDAGIVHRDLKPANIKIDPDGRVKVLDFGLARADEASSTSSSMSQLPTLTTPHSPTNPGAILGTAPYMSPEQARGRRVDKRSDIWSFGVVLYECLTGLSPFAGETATDSIGAILHKDVDAGLLPDRTPTNVRRAIQRCLHRDKNLRYRDIGDVRIELLTPPDMPEGAQASSSSGAITLLYVIAGIVISALATYLVLRGSDATPAQHARPIPADLLLEINEEHPLDGWPFPQISDDASRVVFVTEIDGQRHLVVRDLDQRESRLLPSTAGSFEPSLSPDGNWVAFRNSGSIHRMAIDGSPPIQICEVSAVRGTAWLDDQTLLLAEASGPLHTVDIDEGILRPVYEDGDASTYSDRHPSVLPNGAGTLFVRTEGDSATWASVALYATRFDGTQPKLLMRGASHGRYLDTGHIVFQREGTLMAAAFDIESLEITSTESPVLTGMMSLGPGAPPHFALSASGTLIYFDNIDYSGRSWSEMVQLDLEGNPTPLLDTEHMLDNLAISADGRHIAVVHDGPALAQLITLERDRELERTILEVENGQIAGVCWTPDHRYLVFSMFTSEFNGLCRIRADGLGQPELLHEYDATEIFMPWGWSPDGTHLIASSIGATDSPNLFQWRTSPDGSLVTPEPEPVLRSPGSLVRASVSPDAKWLLYANDAQGEFEVFVTSRGEENTTVQISTTGGYQAAWHPSENKIYYMRTQSREAQIFEVEFTIDESGLLIPSRPNELLNSTTAPALVGINQSRGFAFAPDASAFVFSRSLGTGEAPLDSEIRRPRIFVNWTEAIRDSLPQAE
ncbi:MAG: protein kinase domain-containing protein [Planctomycetota bacterium]|jgi:serine/threonine-protein kinase